MAYLPATIGLPTRPILKIRVVLVGSLGGAGFVHLMVGQEHLGESALIGSAMLAGAITQLGLALVAHRGATTIPVAVAIVVLNVGFITGWLAAVTVGLPVDPHPHSGMTGEHLGQGGSLHVETPTPLAIVTVALELAGIAAAALVWRRGRREA